LSFSLYAGTVAFESVGSIGVAANLTVYLVKRFNMGQLSAANITNIFYGTFNFAPLLGAFISDAYLGRFRTLAYGSFFTFLVCPWHSPISPACVVVFTKRNS
jgi:hypothetical protein